MRKTKRIKRWREALFIVVLVGALCILVHLFAAIDHYYFGSVVLPPEIVSCTTSAQDYPDALDEETGVTEADAESHRFSNSTVSDTEMSVHFLDVGQGDATLVVNGEHAMLIDTGTDDCGTKLQLYLNKQGIERLDYLVLTHTDADHIGSADVIITKFPIDTVLMGDYPKDTATYRDTIYALKAGNLSYMVPSAGDTYALGDASFTIVGPVKAYDNSNDTSLCLLLQKGNDTFLFTGDAGVGAEEDMLNAGWNLDADVYHVGHHGSRYSSGNTFLDAVSPTYAVISCGDKNEYGHPHAQTLISLRKLGVSVFRTDEQGTIVATTSGNKIKWNCAPSETWR